jgi:cytochrome b involved in lipid metabolism
MKKSVAIALFIFWTITVSLITAFFVNSQNKKNIPLALQNNSTEQKTVKTKGKEITLSSAEAAKHNTASDCWMIVAGKVYNFTAAMNAHPGGAGTILAHCGQDSTNAFATKDIGPGRNHSGNAYSLLSNYLIGDLNNTITRQELTNTETRIASSTSNINLRKRDDDGQFEDD